MPNYLFSNQKAKEKIFSAITNNSGSEVLEYEINIEDRNNIQSNSISNEERLECIKKLAHTVLTLSFTWIIILLAGYSLLKFIIFMIINTFVSITLIEEIPDEKWIKFDKKIKYTNLVVKIFSNRYWTFWKKK